MKVAEAKEQFIQDWGILAGNWGIPRTMGQVHALLLVNKEPLSAEEIMNALAISRGNCNGTVRDLLQWGLVYKTTIAGERREYFAAEKDMWKVAQLIARERRRRELEPVIKGIAKYQKLEGPKQEVKDFQEMIKDIQSIANIADKALELLSKAGITAFLKGLH